MKKFRNLTLSSQTKITFITFGVLVYLGVFATIFTMNQVKKLIATIDYVNSNKETALEMFNLTGLIAINSDNSNYISDLQNKVNLFEQRKKIIKNGGVIEESGLEIKAADEDLKNTFVEVDNLWKDYKINIKIIKTEQFFLESENSSIDTSVAGMQTINKETKIVKNKIVVDALNNINEDISELLKLHTVIKKSISQKMLIKQKILIFVLALSLLLILIMVVLSIIAFDKIVVKPSNKLVVGTRNLADGDLNDLDLYLRNDEMGRIGKSLVRLKSRLNNILDFVQEISDGKFNKEFTTESDNDMIGKALLEMKDNFVKAAEEREIQKIEEKKRNWATHGLAKFGEILRLNNNDMTVLSYNIISNLVKYLEANQGGIFLLVKDSIDRDAVSHFELEASFAYDRKKFSSKRIEWKEGLVGRCALEKEHIYMTNLPENYINITSGLGESTPRSLLLVPLILNDEIFGVVEIASLRKFQDYEIEFVKQVGESIASTISSVQIAQRTTELLETSQQQSEEMKAQEEEMRQNMEELQATQEEMMKATEKSEEEVEALKQELEELRAKHEE